MEQKHNACAENFPPAALDCRNAEQTAAWLHSQGHSWEQCYFELKKMPFARHSALEYNLFPLWMLVVCENEPDPAAFAQALRSLARTELRSRIRFDRFFDPGSQDLSLVQFCEAGRQAGPFERCAYLFLDRKDGKTALRKPDHYAALLQTLDQDLVSNFHDAKGAFFLSRRFASNPGEIAKPLLACQSHAPLDQTSPKRYSSLWNCLIHDLACDSYESPSASVRERFTALESCVPDFRRRLAEALLNPHCDSLDRPFDIELSVLNLYASLGMDCLPDLAEQISGPIARERAAWQSDGRCMRFSDSFEAQTIASAVSSSLSVAFSDKPIAFDPACFDPSAPFPENICALIGLHIALKQGQEPALTPEQILRARELIREHIDEACQPGRYCSLKFHISQERLCAYFEKIEIAQSAAAGKKAKPKTF